MTNRRLGCRLLAGGAASVALFLLWRGCGSPSATFDPGPRLRHTLYEAREGDLSLTLTSDDDLTGEGVGVIATIQYRGRLRGQHHVGNDFDVPVRHHVVPGAVVVTPASHPGAILFACSLDGALCYPASGPVEESLRAKSLLLERMGGLPPGRSFHDWNTWMSDHRPR